MGGVRFSILFFYLATYSVTPAFLYFGFAYLKRVWDK